MANHMEPVKGLVGRVARRRLTQVEVEAGTRLPRLQQVLDWLPRCWSHINKFLETHSSSDVTIGKDSIHILFTEYFVAPKNIEITDLIMF